MSKFLKLCLAACSAGALYAGHQVPLCPDIRGATELFWKHNLRFLLIGEVHGTKETPAIFGDLVCQAARNGKKIVAGLEFSMKDQPALDEFLRSSNAKSAAEILLAKDNWKSFDGRSSFAMLALLQRLKGMKVRGEIQDVIFF